MKFNIETYLENNVNSVKLFVHLLCWLVNLSKHNFTYI